MKTRVPGTFLLGCVASSIFAISAFARFGQVDQEHLALTYPNSQANFVIANNRGAAQTFTVERPGILSAFEVGLIQRADTEKQLVADVRRVVNDVPDFSESGILATRTMSSSIVPIEGYPGVYISRFTLVIDFRSDNLQVAVGDQLALHLHSDGDPEEPGTSFEYPRWWVDSPGGSGYDGGDLYGPIRSTIVVPPLPPGVYPFNNDAHFRTYVLVPEPGTVLLMLIGLTGFVGLHRSRAIFP